MNPFRVWNQFFFQSQSARPLGMMRVCYGLLALANLAFCAVELDHWYTDAGLLQGDEARIAAGFLLNTPLHYLQSPFAMRVAFSFTALAALGLTVGWRTKLMSILFYGGMLSIHNRNTVSSSGADVLLLVFGFNMMLSSCGAAYSIDNWLASRKRGTVAEPLILAWPMRLFQFQISLVYALAAALKCGGSLWINGSAIHYVLNNVEVRRLDLSFLSHYPILINLMTYSALLFEFSLAFGLWFRTFRPIAITFGIMLHLGILATVNIPIFGELMWIGYLAFLTPPEFAALTRFCDVRRWFGFRPAPTAEVEPEVNPPALTTQTMVAEPRELDFEPDFVIYPTIPAAMRAGKPVTIRVDGPAPAIPAPHRDQPTRQQAIPGEREFAEATMDPWDSYQILL